MAVEERRGCGFRKIGGLYLVSPPGGLACDRLPYPLDVCPTCHHGFKQTRGWTWIDLKALVAGVHAACMDYNQMVCPMCMPSKDRVGMLWIGEKFYHTTHHFKLEATRLGVSRRIKAIPRDFELGKTWVLLAHPRAVRDLIDWVDGEHRGAQEVFKAGIFMIWKPKRIEKILPESKRGSDEAMDLEERGITCVYFPDNDPDHQGTVYEDETDDQLELVTNGNSA